MLLLRAHQDLAVHLRWVGLSNPRQTLELVGRRKGGQNHLRKKSPSLRSIVSIGL